MSELARWCFRHRFTVVTIWVATLVAIAVPYLMLGAGYNDTFNLPGMESTKAQSLLQANTPAQAGDSDQIVIHTRHGSVQDPAVQRKVASMLTEVAALPSVASVQSMYTPAGAAQISPDRTTAFATVTFDAQGDQVPIADTTRVIHTAQAAADANVQVELGGVAVTDATGTSTPSTEYIGILAAGVILFIAFGSLLGMLVPLLVAIAGVGTGMITIGLLSHVTTIGTIAPTVAALIGLGVGIDYALFIVTRYRSGLQQGLPPQDAAVRALNTSGRAVLFAGGTVIIALLGMLVLRITPLTGIGVAAATTVLFTVLAAVTLLPALLGLFGGRLITRRRRRRLAATGPQAAPAGGGVWGRWADLVARHKAAFSVAALLIIAVLSVPTLSARTGSMPLPANSPAPRPPTWPRCGARPRRTWRDRSARARCWSPRTPDTRSPPKPPTTWPRSSAGWPEAIPSPDRSRHEITRRHRHRRRHRRSLDRLRARRRPPGLPPGGGSDASKPHDGPFGGHLRREPGRQPDSRADQSEPGLLRTPAGPLRGAPAQPAPAAPDGGSRAVRGDPHHACRDQHADPGGTHRRRAAGPRAESAAATGVSGARDARAQRDGARCPRDPSGVRARAAAARRNRPYVGESGVRRPPRRAVGGRRCDRGGPSGTDPGQRDGRLGGRGRPNRRREPDRHPAAAPHDLHGGRTRRRRTLRAADDGQRGGNLLPETRRGAAALLTGGRDAGDARPDDLTIARGLDAINEVTTVAARHVRSSWAGLRSFAPDRDPVVGFDARAEGLFWFAGQGGFGIQTAPALARLGAALLRGAEVAADLTANGVVVEQISVARFSSPAGEPSRQAAESPQKS